MEHSISNEKLFDSLLSNQPSPHRNVSMETSLMRALVRHRESPDETSHKGDTHAHSYAHSQSLIVTHSRWLITEGFPKLVQWRHFNFHIFKNRFCVNWVDFSISLCASFIKNVSCDGETSFNLSTSLFFYYSVAVSCVSKKKKTKITTEKPTPDLTPHEFTMN